MKILVAGAGALGGYFGGRLLQAGQDVTFLARPSRAAQLAASGLVIHSPWGDAHLASAPTVLAHQFKAPADLVIVACKAYDLEGTIAAFAPAVGPETTILPLQNGLRHIDRLTERFGFRKVLGGLGAISAALDESGAVLHLGREHTLAFGELDGVHSPRVDAIAAAFASARFDSQPSDRIMQALWEKWVHVATLAGATSLMRASVGDIVRAGAQGVALELLNECSRIAAHNGFAPSPEALGRTRAAVTAPGSSLTASLLTDIERGAPTEGDHILGDLLRRGRWSTADTVLLPLAYAQLRSYEARRTRDTANAEPAQRLAA
ncbi:ketopantoate reductase family protein [Variovorax sp. PBL-E5]|uniref:ketopantoate reductase family protein n=1 Tax=Variovorax sp. PBL-E5 TaxID=434014 RepID=UPI00131777FE|nr:ketopantoate reductase family protein [Variovorax sp. PBL-E5]VTU45930.1 2-dehydropantoate 2-reductase [Variovorax sp. PBL-E5]